MSAKEGVEDGCPHHNPPKRLKISTAKAIGRDGAEGSFVATLTSIMTSLLENSQKNLDVLAQALASGGARTRASGTSSGERNANTNTSSKSDDEEHQVLVKCMEEALNGIEDLSGPLYAKAFGLLVGGKAWRKMFPDNRKGHLIEHY